MTGQELCRHVIRECKYVLSLESDPDKRALIASHGLEFNSLLLINADFKTVQDKVDEIWGVKKKCIKCNKLRAIRHFKIVSSTQPHKTEGHKTYYSIRSWCHLCTLKYHKKWRDSNANKSKRKIKDQFTAY